MRVGSEGGGEGSREEWRGMSGHVGVILGGGEGLSEEENRIKGHESEMEGCQRGVKRRKVARPDLQPQR